MRTGARWLVLAVLAGIAQALPKPPQDTWDPADGGPEMEALGHFLAHLRKAINEKNWQEVNPRDFIGHDKFNIADGFGVDVFSVEEMQELGDPVIAVEKEMSLKRSAEERKNRKSRWLGF